MAEQKKQDQTEMETVQDWLDKIEELTQGQGTEIQTLKQARTPGPQNRDNPRMATPDHNKEHWNKTSGHNHSYEDDRRTSWQQDNEG